MTNTRLEAARKKQSESPIWTEKYRPVVISDCILPARIKTVLLDSVSDPNNLQNLFLYGTAGVGKTTVAKCITNELDADFLHINASSDRNIDMLRTTVRQFVSTVSLSDSPKIVLMDEADYLNATSTQPAFRAFIEEFSKTSRFIFTANYPDKVMDALKSRMVSIDFTLTADEKNEVADQWIKRLEFILQSESVSYELNVLTQLVNRYFPDFRKTINELHRFSTSGKLDSSVITAINSSSTDFLFKALKEKNFFDMKDWCFKNPSYPFSSLITEMWDKHEGLIPASALPLMVMLMSDYDYKSKFVSCNATNTLAFLTSLSREL